MAHMPREPEAFGEHVARILKRHYPDRTIELVGPLDLILSGKHLGLENLYRMVLHEPDRGVEMVENYLERLIEGDSLSSMPLPLSVAKPRIMPRIQPLTIFEHLDQEQVTPRRDRRCRESSGPPVRQGQAPARKSRCKALLPLLTEPGP